MVNLGSFKTGVSLSATLTLGEEEIAALDALAGYGDEAFLKTFYEKMGTAYLKPHEAGLLRLFDAVRATAGPALRSAQEARKILADAALKTEGR